jgi:response regulator NasT
MPHPADLPAAADRAGGASDPSAAGVRVLVAEDDDDARELLVEALSALGHTVVAALATGREAVERAAALRPDAVLLDVHLAGDSGIDAARGIAEQLPATAVLLCTGDRTLSLSAREVAETGAVTLLAKPTPPNALDAALRLAVARAGALAAATRDADAARAALEARKVVERAKGVLMRRTGCGEDDAYRVLQRTSQDRATSMLDVARAVLASEPPAGGRRPRAAR